MSQVPKHKANHCHINEGFACLRQALIVPAQPALTVQPSKCALHHPRSRQYHKALLSLCLVYYLQLPAKHAFHPLYQFSSVASISPYRRQPAEAPPVRIAWLFDALKQALQQHVTSISVVHRGGSHYHQHHQTQRIHYQVSLAPSYILACIIAALFTCFSRAFFLAVSSP